MTAGWCYLSLSKRILIWFDYLPMTSHSKSYDPMVFPMIFTLSLWCSECFCQKIAFFPINRFSCPRFPALQKPTPRGLHLRPRCWAKPRGRTWFPGENPWSIAIWYYWSMGIIHQMVDYGIDIPLDILRMVWFFSFRIDGQTISLSIDDIDDC